MYFFIKANFAHFTGFVSFKEKISLFLTNNSPM